MTDLLQVAALSTHFGTRNGTIRAVDDVSLTIVRGETVGLVGESGCGKSTLGKTLVGLLRPTSGSIRIHGAEVGSLGRRARRPFARRMQMVFQDPFSSLNPRIGVGRLIEEPLIVHGIGTAAERRARADAMMARVGLSPAMRDRYPHEFSGGQRQRIGIARGLVLEPDLLICDEPVSALDLSVQAQVINLLVDLQAELGHSYLFISHDLAVVEHIADRILVMYLGRIVESAVATELWSRPLHPYSRGLAAAAPVADPVTARARPSELIRGDVPSLFSVPSGCGFHPRCPIAIDRCVLHPPELQALSGNRAVACHRVAESRDGGITLAGNPV